MAAHVHKYLPQKFEDHTSKKRFVLFPYMNMFTDLTYAVIDA